MSHRYRSHCCCDDPELLAECFLGFGTPPKQEFNPRKDRCNWEGGDIYANAQGQNIWDNWSFCSHNRDQELMLTLERDVTMNLQYGGGYAFPDTYQANGTPDQCGGIDCNDWCQNTNNTGIWSSNYYTIPNDPMYVRYRRLKSNFGELGIRRPWQDHAGDAANRAYIWRASAFGPGSPGWAPDYNGGHQGFPLFQNPNAGDAGPDDQVYPHGTAVRCNCTVNNDPYVPCDDIPCAKVANSYGYNNFSRCSNHYGNAGFPLTPSQAQLIGENWDTNEYGYIPTQGWVNGEPCISPCPPEDDTDPTYPYFNRIREYGGRYFWLQGISNHDSYLDDDEDYRLYRDWQLDFSNHTIVERYKSFSCEYEPYGLWRLSETLIGVFHRETWWERYWNGFTRDAFRSLGPDHHVPLDSYFVANESADGYLALNKSPELIGFGCAGIPVFSWELAYLYLENGDVAIGGDSRVPDDVIENYEIPPEPINTIRSILVEQGLQVPEFNQDTPQETRETHMNILYICLAYGFAIPSQITDILELYDILPKPINYGEEQDYKIFKKKIRYFDPTPVFTDRGSCCINVEDLGRIYGNCATQAVDREEGESTKSCNYGPCADAVCKLDPYCCNVVWDDYCTGLINESTAKEACTVSTYCIDATYAECRLLYGGQFASIDPCPGKDEGDFLNFDRQTFCLSEDGITLGSCCNGALCNETTEENCGFDFKIAKNCEYEGQICTGWEGPPPISGACLNWQNVKTKDFYFYGRPGGWTWICTNDLLATVDDNTGEEYGGIGPNAIYFPGPVIQRNGPCWNAIPNPIDSYNTVSDPINVNHFDTCCDISGGGDCQEVPPPPVPVCGGGGQIYYETEDGEEGNTDGQPGVVINCSHESVTITCRGAWFQWHQNDYTIEADATFVGCDSINNAFFLVQDPYEFGNQYNFDIELVGNDDFQYYRVTINGNPVPYDVVAPQGTKNRFNLKNAFDWIENEIETGSSFYPNEVIDGITYEPFKPDFIIGAQRPSETDDEIIGYQYTEQNRFYKEDDDGNYILNPFEKIDGLRGSESPRYLFWQIVTIYKEIEFDPDIGPTYIVLPNAISASYGSIDTATSDDSSLSCNDGEFLKYSGEAARIYEYQWYHPPYAVVNSEAGDAYACADGDIDCFPSCPYDENDEGQCCNEKSYIGYIGQDLCYLMRGNESGPTPTASIFTDPFPGIDPPEIIP